MKTPNWAKKLCEKGIDLTKIRSAPFRRISKIIGTEKTLDLFYEMMGDYIAVGVEFHKDLIREYCRKFSEDRTERELASDVGVTRSTINAYMNETPKTYAEYIPMFPDM